MNEAAFARLFDHSIVRPDATREEVTRFGSTRTDQFVAAFRALPPAEKEAFAPFLTASNV